MSQQQQPEEKKGFTNPEIMAIEADRQDASTWNIIRLLRDGDYWHANEWSGWLMGVVVHNEMKRRYPDVERVAPKPVKKHAKNIDGEYIFVGCQEKSFDKYIPKEIQIDFKPVDNLRIDIAIELPAEMAPLSYERLQQMFLEWKQSVPLTKEKNGRSRQQDSSSDTPPFAIADVPPGLMAILTRLLSFPLANRTPLQAHEFIGELQKDIISHL
ncbi:MAG: hypothetical protein K6F74_05650 [Prevotella sp.]|nr:hypothetical protein [Prevotella sp.]